MPVEQGYEARIMPQAGTPRPLPTADDFGAGIAGSVAQLGDQMHAHDIRAFEAQRAQAADQETSDFAHRFALHRQAMDGVVQQLRDDPSSPDYSTHVQQVLEANDAANPDLLKGITEQSVLRRAQGQIDEFRTQLTGQESNFTSGQRIAKTVTDARAAQDIMANRVRHATTGSQWAAEMGNWQDYTAGLQGLPPAQRDALMQEGHQVITASYVDHLNDTNPSATLDLIDKGTFDPYLKPEQLQQLRQGSQVEIRRQQALADHAANVQWAATKEQIETVKVRAGQGIDVSAQLPALAQAAQQHGDTSTVAELQGLGRDSAFAKSYGALPPLAWDQQLAKLRAIPEARRSADDQAAIKYLTDKRDGHASAVYSDPMGWAAQNAPAGTGPTPLQTWAPDELQAREAWMKGPGAAYGFMQPLIKTEVKAAQDQMQSGDKGYRDTLATIGQGFSGRVAMQAVRQILPNDGFAQSAVALAPNVMRQALDGRAVLKANSEILSPADDTEKTQIGGLKAGFAQALGAVPAAQRNGIMQVANAISARALEENGELSKQMTGAMFARSIDAALGSTGSGPDKRGGIGWWGGRMYLLPGNTRQQDFEGAVSAYLAKGKGAMPLNPDGTTAALRNATPVAMGGGRYQFKVGDRYVSTKGGAPFTMTVGAP